MKVICELLIVFLVLNIERELEYLTQTFGRFDSPVMFEHQIHCHEHFHLKLDIEGVDEGQLREGWLVSWAAANYYITPSPWSYGC